MSVRFFWGYKAQLGRRCVCELYEDRSEAGNLRVDPGDQSSGAVWLLGGPSAD